MEPDDVDEMSDEVVRTRYEALRDIVGSDNGHGHDSIDEMESRTIRTAYRALRSQLQQQIELKPITAARVKREGSSGQYNGARKRLRRGDDVIDLTLD